MLVRGPAVLPSTLRFSGQSLRSLQLAAKQTHQRTTMSSSSGFPIARAQLPKVSLSRHEQLAFKRMVTRMLQNTVHAFDRHTHASRGDVDTSKWKVVGSRDGLQVYREREAGATGAATADALPRGSTVAPLTPPGVLLTGFARGKVENVLDAVTTKSQEDLALLLSFMHHESVVDCAVLHTIEAPTESDPFHFLGIKYCARRAPAAGSRLVKHRDSVYLEFTGYTETARGERLGFNLMHSVELAEFPPLTARNSTRTLHSVRYLYRQLSENVVEVFMQGDVDVSGMAFTAYTNDALFGLSTLVACAEAKRLTQMWRAQQARNDSQKQRKWQAKRGSTALECSMCRQKQKLFGGASLAACELCANSICTRCRSDKKVFEPDANGIIGKFRKVSACKCCILAANKARSQPEEPQMRIVMSEHLQRDREGSRVRRRGTSSPGSLGTRSRADSNCASAFSGEFSQAQQVNVRLRNESQASTASTESFSSSRECPVVPVSLMGMHVDAHEYQLVYTFIDQQVELHQQRRVNIVKTSTERAHPTQQVGGQKQQQLQLTLRDHHLQSSDLTPNRQQALVACSRHSTLRRVASTGSAGDYSTGDTHAAPSSQQSDLYARMVELNRVAESTYNTTQDNNVYLSQMRSRRRGTSVSRYYNSCM
ncbi:hypothetical protein PRNP1_015503 [Phytophthora ramorum]